MACQGTVMTKANQRRVYCGFRVSEDEPRSIMEEEQSTRQQAWCWSKSWELTSWFTNRRQREICQWHKTIKHILSDTLFQQGFASISNNPTYLGSSIQLNEPIGVILIRPLHPLIHQFSQLSVFNLLMSVNLSLGFFKRKAVVKLRRHRKEWGKETLKGCHWVGDYGKSGN